MGEGLLYDTGSNCHKKHYYGFIFTREAPDMGFQFGHEIMASLLKVVTHMQKLSY